MDVVSAIIEYESGRLTDDQTLDLFSELMKSGILWKLQGAYQRVARKLIEHGYLSVTGKILKRVEAEG